VGIKADDSRWDVTLWGKNLTDEYYWNNATQGLDDVYRLASMPRTYGITFGYNF
jgi:outer membrane receptor protein involved in Fe transport